MSLLTRTVFLFSFLLIGATANSQNWKHIDEKASDQLRIDRMIVPDRYETFQTSLDTWYPLLDNAPLSFSNPTRKPVKISVPMPDGSIKEFYIKRSDVFHADLAARYPMIRSYTGKGVDDSSETLKLSISHKGMTAMVLSNHTETIYIDRYADSTPDMYIAYRKSDFHKDLAPTEGSCTLEEAHDGHKHDTQTARYGDCQLRKYRLALACTGEYANFHGGNIPDVLAEYNASMTRINGIFEREFAITMELIPNTDELIFLNAGSDPYTNNSGSAMLAENQTTIDNIIGFDNYDIGHVYSTGGGGIASLRSPCTNRKARGVTGLNSPVGDPFWVDYVSHEMGHQYGGNHTYNNSCGNNRNASTAFEPGSGTTIMSYAGICSPDIQNQVDDYFHSITQQEVANFVVAGNGDCAEIIPMDNIAPTLEPLVGNGNIIPMRTPFMLTAVGADEDGDAITYCWEQRDNEIATQPPNSNSNDGPTFRSYSPTTNPTRMFPRINSILSGLNGNTWERLTNQSRTMNFNIVVRDNNIAGGCTADDNLTLNFTSEAGPFLISSQNSTETWNAGEEQVVSWDVANTDVAPVLCTAVDILLSLDGGETFDIVLADDQPNTGSATITVPFEFSTECRIMVKAANNIFFDINNDDISIIAPFSAVISPASQSVCADQDAEYEIDFTVFTNESTSVVFDIENLPAGATATFSPETATADELVTLTIGNINTVEPGSYSVIVTATGDALTLEQEIELIVAPTESQEVAYITPENGASNIDPMAVLTWEEQSGIQTYEIQLSESPIFDMLFLSNVINTSFLTVSNLESRTVYYWRVRSLSDCFTSDWAEISSFQTGGPDCNEESAEVNEVIAMDSGDEVASVITLTSSELVADLKISLNIDHLFVGDLSATLTAPDGSVIQLFDRPGVPDSQFGCNQQDVRLVFADNAMLAATDLEGLCQTTGIALEGEYQPIDPFSELEGLPLAGDWTLTVFDELGPDGGTFLNWSISSCVTSEITPATILTNNTLLLNNVLEGNISTALLSTEGMLTSEIIYTIMTTPSQGSIQVQDGMGIFTDLSVGDQFSQADINTDLISYSLNMSTPNMDSFTFDVVDDNDGYLANQTFNINAQFSAITATVAVNSEISCFGADDGSISITAVGGTVPYTYSIDGENFIDTNVFENLASETYIVTVRDSNMEEFMLSITLDQPTEITVTTNILDGILTVTATGGSGGYLYTTDGMNYSDQNEVEVVDGQTYFISVQDANGCISMVQEFTYYNISSVSTSIIDVSCNGANDGSLVVDQVVGGLAPYTYSVGEQSNSNGVFENLLPDTYDLQITDADGNVFDMTVVITQPEALVLTTDIILDSIYVASEGGTMPYRYSLDGVNYADVDFLVGMEDETYTVYVQDANGCITTEDGVLINTAVINSLVQDLRVYPNPISQSFTFGYTSQENIQYAIYDLTGRKVVNQKARTNEIVTIGTLAEGIYTCKATIAGYSKVFKLVVVQ